MSEQDGGCRGGVVTVAAQAAVRGDEKLERSKWNVRISDFRLDKITVGCTYSIPVKNPNRATHDILPAHPRGAS
jgi:hypothetical protein